MSDVKQAKKASKKAKPRGGFLAAAAAAALGGSSSSMSAGPARTFEEIVAEAEAAMDRCEPDSAAILYEEALQLRPSDTSVMDSLGAVLYELGDEPRALELFQSSTKLAPDAGHTAWMHLAQMTTGKEAVENFQKGITLMQAKLSSAPAAEAAVLRREISNGYCSIAEVYMTDLCDEPEAEGVSDQSAQAAVSADPENPEAYSLAASVRLSQSRPADAVPLLKRAAELLEAIEDAEGNDDENEDGQEDGAIAESNDEGMGGAAASSSALSSKKSAKEQRLFGLPAYQSRLSTAKMCLEVELNAEAGDILDGLLAEDDTVMEVWFLCGEAHYHGGDFDSAQDTISTAHAMTTAAINALEAAGGKGKKGGAGSGKASSAAAVAASSAVVEFTFEAIQVLMTTPLGELKAQQDQFAKLLEVIKAAAAKAAAEPGAGAAADDGDEDGGNEMDDS